jgi:hypothetical protein
MNMMNIKTGVAVAAAAASLFALSTPAMSADMMDKAEVKCAAAKVNPSVRRPAVRAKG